MHRLPWEKDWSRRYVLGEGAWLFGKRRKAQSRRGKGLPGKSVHLQRGEDQPPAAWRKQHSDFLKGGKDCSRKKGRRRRGSSVQRTSCKKKKASLVQSRTFEGKRPMRYTGNFLEKPCVEGEKSSLRGGGTCGGRESFRKSHYTT